jgi:ankyrin repeat protein
MGCTPSASTIDPNGIKRNKDGSVDFRPIHSSVRWNNSFEEISFHTKTKEQIESIDHGNGNRPIHIAAQNGHFDLVKLMIEKSADLNSQNHKGNTALHMAIEYDYYDSAMALISNGADASIKNSDGHQAIDGIEGTKNINVVALLCARVTDDANESLRQCLLNPNNIEKGDFIKDCLKVKKSMGAQWTSETQDLFKQVLEIV